MATLPTCAYQSTIKSWKVCMKSYYMDVLQIVYCIVSKKPHGAYLIFRTWRVWGFLQFFFLERRGFIKFQSDIGQFFLKFWAILLNFIITFFYYKCMVSRSWRGLFQVLYLYIFGGLIIYMTYNKGSRIFCLEYFVFKIQIFL